MHLALKFPNNDYFTFLKQIFDFYYNIFDYYYSFLTNISSLEEIEEIIINIIDKIIHYFFMFIPGIVFIIIIIFLFLILPLFLYIFFISMFIKYTTDLEEKIKKKILPIKEILILFLMGIFVY